MAKSALLFDSSKKHSYIHANRYFLRTPYTLDVFGSIERLSDGG